MLDVAEYEDIQLDLPNIIARWEIAKDRSEYKFVIDDNLRTLITQLAMKNPSWTFVCGGPNDFGIRVGIDTCKAKHFYVYEGREKLGRISWESRGRYGDEVAYVIHNERIANQRERGNAAKTKDLNKAIKLVNKSFGAKTLTEFASENISKCGDHLRNIKRDKTYDFEGPYFDAAKRLIPYILGNWDEISKVLLATGKMAPEKVNAIPNQYEEFNAVREMEKCFANGKGVVVTIHGNDYAVSNPTLTDANAYAPPKIYGTDTLPSTVRGKLGMLKLVEPKQVLANVGYRISDTAFFIMETVDDGAN
jgi:hypothetical protein